MSALSTALVGRAVRRRIRSGPRGRKRQQGPSPQVLARWVLDHLPQTVGIVAVVYLWGVTGSLPAALGIGVVFTGALFAGWLGWKQHRTGMTVSASLAEIRRRRRLVKQWPKALTAVGVKQGLRLRKITGDDKGDLSALVHAGQNGCPPETIIKGATTLAPVVGCREVTVTPLGFSGTVQIRFLWSDPLGRTVLPSDLTAAPKGVAPTALDDGGRVIGIPVLNSAGETIFTPIFVGGVSGSGKSSWLWAFLAGLVAQQIPVRLRVLDPAGGTELAALGEALDPDGTGMLRVHRYSNKASDATALVKEMSSAMECRMRAMSGKTRLHKPTLAEPLDLFVIDEFLRLPKALKDADSGLAEVMSLGRKAGFSVVALSQIGQADAIGRVRDLFPRRLCFATRTREQTVAILGSNDLAEMAPAHKISERTPGVFYGVSDTERAMTKGRTVYLDDRATRQIARGHLPFGMEGFGTRVAVKVPTALYRLYNRDRELLYVGITSSVERRMREHADDKAWWPEVHMATSKVTWWDDEDTARKQESDAIRSELPRYNQAGNRRNPLRRLRAVA